MKTSVARRAAVLLAATGLLVAGVVAVSSPAFADDGTAVADSYSVQHGSTLTVSAAQGVLANDSNPDGLVPLGRSVPTEGSVTLNSDGSFVFDPGFNLGVSTFTYCLYSIGQSRCISAPATVTITILGPDANDDLIAAHQDTTLSLPAPGVLANDSNLAAGDVVLLYNDETTQHGTLNLQTDGGFSYVPNPGYHGGDTFKYCISYTTCNLPTQVATVTIIIYTLPHATNDSYSVAQAKALTVKSPGVLGNDNTVGFTGWKVVTNPAHGKLSAVKNDGGFTYTPTASFVGTDTFTYCITAALPTDDCKSDNHGTVSIKVTAVPHAANDAYGTREGEARVVTGSGVLANDTALPKTHSWKVVTAPKTGKLSALTSAGGFTFTPAATTSGTVTFTYCVSAKLSTGSCLTNTATVTIKVAPKTAVTESFKVTAGKKLTVASPGVLKNDKGLKSTDSWTVRTAPKHGTVTPSAKGGFTYTPKAGYTGSDAFNYCVTATLSKGACESNTVTDKLTISKATSSARVVRPE